MIRLRTTVRLVVLAGSILAGAALPADVQVLFLGDQGHHRPAERYLQVRGAMADRGIQFNYTERISDLNARGLSQYPAILIYANIERIGEAEEKALLDYVRGGGGLVALHCASFCFHNSPAYIELVGAQFLRHGTGTFRTEIAPEDHPILRGFGGFASWDETYVHHRHNDKNRLVLEYRVDNSGREPWTWVRTEGKGRVFYTAWGHDDRTWGNPGFQNLLERGIRWAAGDDKKPVPKFVDASFPVPQMTPPRTDVAPFEYVDVGAKIPNYVRSSQWGTQGEPFSKMQKPLSPEESLKHFVTPQGFHVELFASEPDLQGKPMCMNWDERGRLWIAETLDYPNELQPPGSGRDRIRICEDTDGDAKADKFTVFAEGLSIPAAMAFVQGGVIVQDGTETVLLKDRDGDDRADERAVLITGWAMNDTHGGVSNFQYGLDNWIWAMQGYNDSHPVLQGEPQPGFRQGFFRFRPDGSAIEFLRSTDNNTWGLGISEEGIIFGSTANRNPSVYMPIPNRYYDSVRGWTPRLVLRMISDTYLFNPITDKIRQVDQFGGYTAGAGKAIYTARVYPREYWNRVALVNEPTGHLVGAFVLTRDGADFHSTSPFNLLASDDEWSAPIMAEVGPDGHVWVIDWYNYIVQHNPTPHGFETGRGNAYQTDLRDKRHGRIYRVVYDGAPREPTPSLAGAAPERLVATLAHPTMLWRKHAQRVLVERGERDVIPALAAMIQDPRVDVCGLNVGAIHALWTLHGLGALDGGSGELMQVVEGALRHPSAGVRRNAVQVLPARDESIAAILQSGLLADPDAQVRLMAILALADMPSSARAGAAIAEALLDSRNRDDRWINDAATSAAAKHGAHFLLACASLGPRACATFSAGGSGASGLAGRDPSGGPPAGSNDHPRSLAAIAAIVAGHLARGPEGKSLPELLVAMEAADSSLVEEVVRGMAHGWPSQERLTLKPEVATIMQRLFPRLSTAGRGNLVRLAALWGSDVLEPYAAEIADALVSTIHDQDASFAERIRAAHDLIAFRVSDAGAVSSLLDAITAKTAPETAAGILSALRASQADELGSLILDALASFAPSARKAAIEVLLARPECTLSLLDGLDSGAVEIGELSLDQRQALLSHPSLRIRNRAQRFLERGGSLPDPDRQRVVEELAAVARQSGDPVNGKTVFLQQCAKCHVHGEEGKRVGPDLTGMFVHPKEELLVHILDPNRSVEGNYRAYTLVSESGLVAQGLLASESRALIELFDAEGNRRVFPRDEVAQLVATNKSLMPEGFEKQLSLDALRDLLEFLAQRGRYVPIDLSRVATVCSDRGMFYREEAIPERLVFPDWKPKLFNGVPFVVIDPDGGKRPNVVLLYGPQGTIPPRMPRQVELPCGTPARTIHLLSGVSGWGYPYQGETSHTMTVQLQYADGQLEDHRLQNGVHFADYIRRVDVPGSEFAFALRGQQIRYLAIHPARGERIERMRLIKGEDATAPVVMAITVEVP